MRYLYAVIFIAVFICGGLLGYRLAPGPRVREVPVERVVARTVTKEVIRGSGDSQVTERTTTKIENSSKVSPPARKPQYRLSAFIPVNNYQDVTAGAARRLGGNVWLESQFNLKRKEVLVGVSYEF